jgi:hypothetical protein
MLRTILECSVVMALGVLLLAGQPALAEEKKSDKPALSGTWGKKEGELKIEFDDKNVLKIAPHGDAAVIALVCKYTVEKGSVVKVKITGFEGKEEVKKKVKDKFPVGYKFSFKWTAKGDTAKVEDVMGDEVDTLKSHLQGDFVKKE